MLRQRMTYFDAHNQMSGNQDVRTRWGIQTALYLHSLNGTERERQHSLSLGEEVVGTSILRLAVSC